jgi:hypothetical protein
MRKEYIYLALFLALFVSCEEYYKPDLDTVSGILVVESKLTNEPTKNFVQLSMTQDFYGTTEAEKVTGAKVELVQVGGNTLKGSDNGTGYFTFPSVPIPGKTYYLKITNQKDIYQSETVLMPPVPQIDSLYTVHNIEKSYVTDISGNPELVETPGRIIYIDAPITTSLQYYRFDLRAILQWTYTPPNPLAPTWYGWKSKSELGTFNIAGPKEFSSSTKVTKHPIRSLAYNNQTYLDSAAQVGRGWILILDEYGTSKSSYDFHEKLNKQFSAEGSLFDPVITQVYGNIHCTSDASKTALGFFELSSYRQYRYFLNLGQSENSKAVQRRLSRYPDIPYIDGYLVGTTPAFWETN